MWTVVRIDEADYGCEERLPGEPLMVLVTIERDDGRECQFKCAESWLQFMEINEGDEWPDDMKELEQTQTRTDHMAEWMEKYYEAVDEME